MPYDLANGRKYDVVIERGSAVCDDPFEIVLNLARAVDGRMVQHDDQSFTRAVSFSSGLRRNRA